MSGIVLLTGGSGFLGRRIAESLASRGFEVIALGRPKFDLMDRASVDRAVAALRPDIVVHSAAYYGGLGICVAEPDEVFIATSSCRLTSWMRRRAAASSASWASARLAPTPEIWPAT